MHWFQSSETVTGKHFVKGILIFLDLESNGEKCLVFMHGGNVTLQVCKVCIKILAQSL